MGAGHFHHGYVVGDTSIHRLAPETKVVATFVFVMAVVATPREAFWAFAVDAFLVGLVAVAAGLGLARLGRRLVLELPFLAFALFLPFVGGGERVAVWGLELSEPGLWGAWNIVVKGTLGVAAAAVLASTTSVPEMLRALDRLRLPAIVVQIASFMARYLEVIAGDLRRMQIARESRCSSGRRVAQLRAVATSAGALFIRSFERGERVHVAMLARGFDGRMPGASTPSAPGSDWIGASILPVFAIVVCSLAWGVR